MPYFGTASGEKHSLVPHEEPLGIYVTRIADIPDPESEEDPVGQDLRQALCSPLHLKLEWNGGLEFLEISPADIQYEGFRAVGEPATGFCTGVVTAHPLVP